MKNNYREAALPARLRRVSLYSFIVFLVISALLAIAAVLSGSYGIVELKILITTTVIAAASVCALCCSAYAQRTGIVIPGIIGALLAIVAGAMFIVGAWAEVDSEFFWKSAVVFGIFAIATAHALALLGLRLRSSHNWLKAAAAITILTLAAILSMMVWSVFHDDWMSEGTWNLIIVLAIVVVLQTLVIPVLGRVAKDDDDNVGEDVLRLVRQKKDLYADEHGRLYTVMPLTSGVDPSSTQ